MKFETSVQTKRTAMPHDVGHRLEGPLVLITGSDLVTLGLRTVLSISKQDRDLGAQFRELKRACKVSALFSHSPLVSDHSALTCDQCNTRTSCSSRRTETGN